MNLHFGSMVHKPVMAVSSDLEIRTEKLFSYFGTYVRTGQIQTMPGRFYLAKKPRS